MSTPKFPETSVPLREFVSRRVSHLQRAYTNHGDASNSTATATLALLRSGVTKPLGSNLELVAATTSGLYDEDTKLPDTPTHAEQAVYAALTLFGVHQQSKRTAGMHEPSVTFGRALAKLSAQSPDSDSVRRRLNALSAAATWTQTGNHARHLIGQLRGSSIPFDYGTFAADLYWLRFPSTADSVRNRWGRDFHRQPKSQTPEESPAAGAP